MATGEPAWPLTAMNELNNNNNKLDPVFVQKSSIGRRWMAPGIVLLLLWTNLVYGYWVNGANKETSATPESVVARGAIWRTGCQMSGSERMHERCRTSPVKVNSSSSSG